MRIKTGAYSKAGHMMPLLGMSTRDPQNVDADDLRMLEAKEEEFKALPLAFIRHPAGSHSDNIVNTQDANTQYILNTFLPLFPSCSHDFTYPAQLPIEDLTDWVTERTGRITLLNEPPNRIPSIYADGSAAVAIQKAIYAAHPTLQSKMWIQTGKPEVVRYPDMSSPTVVAKHEDCLDAAAAAVAAGLLPARIVTTHKLIDDYPSDLLGFYRTLMDDYVDYFGDDVEVCFQEFNYKEEEFESLEAVLASAEFLLILARLRAEGYAISGAAYHQGFAVGTANIIGLNAPSGQGTWTTGGMYNLWKMFGSKLDNGEYMLTVITDQADDCQVCIVRDRWRRYALYSNRGAAKTLNLDGVTLEYLDSDLTTKSGSWTGTVAANSCGVIRLRRRLVT